MRGANGAAGRQIERPWLQRVGGYVPGRRRSPGEPGAGDDSALAEDEDGQPHAVEGGPGGDDSGQSDRSAAGHPTGAESPEDTPGLSVPPEVEARHEEERKNRASALNRHLASKAFDLEGRYLRALAARFARMVSKVAEDAADMPSQGDDEWDLEELRTRRFTGRLVSQCRMTREKRKVAIVLDTSPSCEHQARLFGSVAQVAEALGDCELYDAPNFAIGARKLTGAWEPLPEPEREWHFERRVVLAFGDFDGIERISKASQVRGNKIYWFCCEERPGVLDAQRDYFLKHYKGYYLPATHLEALMKAMGRVR
ncbi:MAG: hypothetical protein ACHQZQ_08215 [SAR324 cluster bacterium]